MIDGVEVFHVPVLVAGRHRLEAVRGLGLAEIDCFVHDEDDLAAQLWEVDEILMRAELTAAQTSTHLKRRKEIWEEMQSDLGGQTDDPETAPQPTSKATKRPQGTDNLVSVAQE